MLTHFHQQLTMAKPTTGARLRKTFHYPSDDDDDNPSAEVLDEQGACAHHFPPRSIVETRQNPTNNSKTEQETLITTLALQNTTRNKTTHRLLTAIPPLSSIPFLLALLLPPSSTSTTPTPSRLLSLLGLTSLLATAYTLHALDTTETGLSFLDNYHHHTQTTPKPKPTVIPRKKRKDGLLGSSAGKEKSPLTQHLPHLNTALAFLALITGLLERFRLSDTAASAAVSPVLLGALPGVVYGVVIGAKVVMAGVDPARELGGLRYGYKGA